MSFTPKEIEANLSRIQENCNAILTQAMAEGRVHCSAKVFTCYDGADNSLEIAYQEFTPAAWSARQSFDSPRAFQRFLASLSRR
jgi:hypothetical protein